MAQPIEPCATCQTHVHAIQLAAALLDLADLAGIDVADTTYPVLTFSANSRPITAERADRLGRAIARAKLDTGR